MRNFYILQPEPGNPHHAVVADLTEVGEMVPGTRTITRINAHRSLWGQGHGSTLLESICEDADREGVGLSLEINPYGPLNYDQLRDWYVRHGFKPSPKWVGVYIREPQPQEESQL